MIMKSILSGVLLISLTLSALGDELTFEKGVKLKAANETIDIKVGHLVPVTTDWNGDGKKDLIIGHFTGPEGNIRLFLNEGTDASPVLSKGVPLVAAGKPIRMDGG